VKGHVIEDVGDKKVNEEEKIKFTKNPEVGTGIAIPRGDEAYLKSLKKDLEVIEKKKNERSKSEMWQRSHKSNLKDVPKGTEQLTNWKILSASKKRSSNFRVKEEEQHPSSNKFIKVEIDKNVEEMKLEIGKELEKVKNDFIRFIEEQVDRRNTVETCADDILEEINIFPDCVDLGNGNAKNSEVEKDRDSLTLRVNELGLLTLRVNKLDENFTDIKKFFDLWKAETHPQYVTQPTENEKVAKPEIKKKRREIIVDEESDKENKVSKSEDKSVREKKERVREKILFRNKNLKKNLVWRVKKVEKEEEKTQPKEEKLKEKKITVNETLEEKKRATAWSDTSGTWHSRPPLKCFNCGQPGHQQRECNINFPNYRHTTNFLKHKNKAFINYSDKKECAMRVCILHGQGKHETGECVDVLKWVVSQTTNRNFKFL